MQEHNGMAKRINKNLLEMARSMVIYKNLPISIEGHALETTTCIVNLALSKYVHKISCELCPRKKMWLRHIHI